jgi:hypothetical protein
MKRSILPMALAFALTGLLSLALAEDKKADKEVSLKGDLVCGSCALKETKKCENVLVVKEGDKETKYFLTPNEVSKKYDEKVCGGDKIPVTVVGKVVDKDGKKKLTATKIEG